MITLDLYEGRQHLGTRKLTVEELTSELLGKYGSENALITDLNYDLETCLSPLVIDVGSCYGEERYITTDLESVAKVIQLLQDDQAQETETCN